MVNAARFHRSFSAVAAAALRERDQAPPLSVLRNFRSVVDDPIPRFSSIGAGTIATGPARPGEADVSSDRLSSIVGPEPESANQQFR